MSREEREGKSDAKKKSLDILKRENNGIHRKFLPAEKFTGNEIISFFAHQVAIAPNIPDCAVIGRVVRSGIKQFG